MEEEIICELCGGPVDTEYGAENFDGWICEECLSKLSPWIEDFEPLDTEDLEEQLKLREENRQALENFRPTRSFSLPGITEKVFLDDESKTFLVTDGKDLRRENPDIISLDEVLDAAVEVDDDRETLGAHLYRYCYDLSMNICLDHPYIDEISFALHPDTLTYESTEKSFLGFGGFDPEEEPDYKSLCDFGQDLSDALMGVEEGINHKYDVKPGEFRLGEEDPGEEIRQEPEEEVPQKPEGAGEVIVCPWCGARTRVTENFLCEHCGGNI